MKKCIFVFLVLVLVWATHSRAETLSEVVAYTQGNVKLQGYLVYDNAFQGRRPGVIVVHEWWGLNDYARRRADQLASLGYVAFAADMYGRGKVTRHPEEAAEWMNQITKNVTMWRARALAGLEVLKKSPLVDPSRLAAIGYCFGGSTVQQMAYGGDDLRGIVSFHGELIPPPAGAADRVKASILICHGAADPFTDQKTLQNYLSGMEATSLDWQMIIYGNAKHSFTNPDADKAGMAALQYNPKADHRSWADMKVFFDEIFGSR